MAKRVGRAGSPLPAAWVYLIGAHGVTSPTTNGPQAVATPLSVACGNEMAN